VIAVSLRSTQQTTADLLWVAFVSTANRFVCDRPPHFTNTFETSIIQRFRCGISHAYVSFKPRDPQDQEFLFRFLSIKYLPSLALHQFPRALTLPHPLVLDFFGLENVAQAEVARAWSLYAKCS
jgi:hypothetical protein